MASYTQLYLHCVWATWNRQPLITQDIESQLYAAIARKCNELGCVPFAIGGVHDHIHLLVRFSTNVTIARMIGEVKGASSYTITHSVMPGSFFKWQGSYGAFTISKRSVPQVRDYILNQKVHHAAGTILTELERFTDTEADATE
jgi:REP element-mobilizing transposase RayT